MLFDDEGTLLTHSPDTYKIPAVGDVPDDFRVQLLENAPQPDVIHGSKAVGEPPLMLAIGGGDRAAPRGRRVRPAGARGRAEAAVHARGAARRGRRRACRLTAAAQCYRPEAKSASVGNAGECFRPCERRARPSSAPAIPAPVENLEVTSEPNASPQSPAHPQGQVEPPRIVCDMAKFSFTQEVGCMNDGWVEFCAAKAGAPVTTASRAIAPDVTIVEGVAGHAGCNEATEYLVSQPLQTGDCNRRYGALTDAAWNTLCALSQLPETEHFVPGFGE